MIQNCSQINADLDFNLDFLDLDQGFLEQMFDETTFVLESQQQQQQEQQLTHTGALPSFLSPRMMRRLIMMKMTNVLQFEIKMVSATQFAVRVQQLFQQCRMATKQQQQQQQQQQQEPG